MNLFDGPGEMRERCRAFDWASTPLGPVQSWAPELALSVRTVLAAGLPTILLWGPEYTQVYNDAYAALIRERHPAALGRSNREIWPEVWHINKPIFERVCTKGETVTMEDAHYPLVRDGIDPEDVWLTISYSPIAGAEGRVHGVLANMVDTTPNVRYRALQAELDVERSRLATIFRDAPSFLALARGPEHRFVLANEAYLQLVGHRDLVGRTVAEVIPEAEEQGFIPLLDHVLATGEPFVGREIPITLQRAPGAPPEERYLDFVYIPLVENGERTGVIAHGHDITEQVLARQQHERLLAEAEAERVRLRDVLEGMNDGHFLIDADFVIRSVNRAMERVLDVDRALLVGKSFWAAFPSVARATFEADLRRVVEQREEVHFTREYRDARLAMMVEVDAYPAEGGGASVFWRDVTARHRSELALADSEARFRAVQDASPVGSLLTRPIRNDRGEIVDFEFLYANPAAARITGVPLTHIVGARLLSLLPGVASEQNFERFKRVATLGEPWRWEGWYTGDGLNMGVEISVVQAGDLVHARFADVTERIRAAEEREELFRQLENAYREAQSMESRLRDLFEQAPVALAVLTGPEHVFTIVSPRYSVNPGGGRPLLGRTIREAFPEIADTGFPEAMDRVYESGAPYAASERRVLLDDHGDGDLVEHYFDVGYQPLRDANGEVYAIASVAYDVTEQIHARQEVEAARELAERARTEAEAANRSKSEFLAVMSHELRTPLNAIGGYAELIELGIHGPVTEQQRTALTRIQVSQRHLLGLINGVLNYSRVEAGAVTYNLIRVPVAEAIAEAETLIAPQLRAKGLGYTWMGCAPLLGVMADRDKLQQILLNLLSNAVKFTESRGGIPGRIEVSCDVEEGSADEGLPGRVRIHVRDTGVGVAPDRMAAIFEPFVQVDQRLTRRQEGVGLGLTISRDLARGMGGDLTAESEAGVGSVFTLSLPLA